MEEYAARKQEIISTLETMIVNRGGINKKWLIIQPGAYCWQLHIDLLIFQPLSLMYIDAFSIATKAALADMLLPKINVFFNQNTKSNDFEMGEELVPLSHFAKMPFEQPCIITMGLVFICDNIS